LFLKEDSEFIYAMDRLALLLISFSLWKIII